jgi:fatty-acyl-CoA synthase
MYDGIGPQLYSGSTMGEMIVTSLERYPDRIAFVQGEKQITYAELAKKISTVIQLFQSLDLKAGDVVAQLAGNQIETYAVVAATYVSGLKNVSLHSLGSTDDQAYILNDAEAKVLIVDERNADRAKSLRRKLGSALQYFCHGKITGLRDLWDECSRNIPSRLAATGEAEDIARLAYTGGTTGKAKGVMLSHRSLVTNTLLFLAGMEWPDSVRFVCPAPISHGGGSLILPTHWQGGTFILQEGFKPEGVMDAIEHGKANMCFLVPTMLYSFIDHPRAKSLDFSNFHTLLYGAAPANPARIREALQLMGPVLVQGYGQTECPNAILTMSRRDHLHDDPSRLASAGKPHPGIKVRVLDDHDREVPRGEVGELCVRGPLVMSGYWRQPDLTAETVRNGWLHTGDMAKQDDSGFFYLVDRKKDMIISGGFNVYPGDVEKSLAEHPSISAVGVIGIPDEKWGEAVVAVVVRREHETVSAEELIRFVRERKGVVNAPKVIEFVDALPLTALGKPDKNALRSKYWSGFTRNVN